MADPGQAVHSTSHHKKSMSSNPHKNPILHLERRKLKNLEPILGLPARKAQELSLMANEAVN